MAFAFKDHRSDKHGQWVPIHYDGMLTAQIFFGKNSPEDQRFSFFWLGAVEPSWISDFVDAMASTSESEVFGRMVTAYGVNQFALAPNLDLVSDKKSLRIPWDRNHFSKIINCTIFPASIGMNITNIPSPNHPRKPFSLYLWATIEPGVRPKDDKIYDTDVGIKVRYYDWVKSGVQKAIFPYIPKFLSGNAKNGRSIDAIGRCDQAGERALLWLEFSSTVKRIASALKPG